MSNIPNLRVVIGEKIRDYRKTKGLTQTELGNLANMKQTYLGDVERGTRNISLESLEKIMEALEIEPSDLFDFRLVNVERGTDTALLSALQTHYDFLKTRDVEDVQMIHRIARDVLESMDKKLPNK
ncbi:helix-turn-helix transcriptional regulator [Paenibacillus chondroitinus]|uniref:Helix-turn-helix transcriptional regulator n=1 Tax=Paenibacillus chondroitinus TaxID=59842 RepID=A0ABU6DKU6_9BACL|nr:MULTISPECIES: helix-turn-helix transcriptional regulator [Paenibacillus]MCY9657119.1 helix-turn-helix domain-containing protein [Paenibacillus anseongense]MEB4798402.1 helix-turn-helix transcriptional regulator [Paenibacillus chondroitinus]